MIDAPIAPVTSPALLQIAQAARRDAYQRFLDRMEHDDTLPKAELLGPYYAKLFALVYARYGAASTLDPDQYDTQMGELQIAMHADPAFVDTSHLDVMLTLVAAHALMATDCNAAYDKPDANVRENETLAWRSKATKRFLPRPFGSTPKQQWKAKAAGAVEELRVGVLDPTPWNDRVHYPALTSEMDSLLINPAEPFALHRLVQSLGFVEKGKPVTRIPPTRFTAMAMDDLHKRYPQIPKPMQMPDDAMNFNVELAYKQRPDLRDRAKAAVLISHAIGIAPGQARQIIYNLTYRIEHVPSPNAAERLQIEAAKKNGDECDPVLQARVDAAVGAAYDGLRDGLLRIAEKEVSNPIVRKQVAKDLDRVRALLVEGITDFHREYIGSVASYGR